MENNTIFYISQKKSFWKELLHAAVELLLAVVLLLDPRGENSAAFVYFGIGNVPVGDAVYLGTAEKAQ